MGSPNPQSIPVSPDLARRLKLRLQAGSKWGHSNKCKKPLDECGPCQRIMKWFGTLAPRDLSFVLNEPRKANYR